MSGETKLEIILKDLKPQLHEQEFVFCTLPESRVKQLAVNPICQFRDPEGMTLILPKAEAESLKIDYSFPSRMITLSVHSSLEAVGLLATITAKLAEQGISVNVVSAYFHDHLFIPSERAHEAMAVLESFG